MIELKDIVALVICAGLVVVSLLPAKERKSDESDPGAALFAEDGSSTMADTGDGEGDVADIASEIGIGSAGAAPPILDVPHHYLPLVPGSVWIYRVRGPEWYVKAKIWTMKLVEPPGDGTPAKLEIGYDDARETYPLWLDKRSIRFGFLPFIEPVEFLYDRPEAVAGELLPPNERILEDAVWAQEYDRTVEYKYLDKKREWQKMPARGKQRDRAHVKEFRNITVPAGVFRACRVDWLSRLELKADGREVLRELTTEPYRREKMWIVPGIGIVKRTIQYPGQRAAQIVFDLVSYSRPGSVTKK